MYILRAEKLSSGERSRVLKMEDLSHGIYRQIVPIKPRYMESTIRSH